MLKKRVIITLQLNDGVLFRTKKFVPDYRYTTNFVGSEQADEVTILDITRYGQLEAHDRGHARVRFLQAVERYIEHCYTPVTIGGGISTLDEAAYFIQEAGADKVLVNTGAVERRGLLTDLAAKFGSQAVVFGIDVDQFGCTTYRQGMVPAVNIPVEEWAAQGVELGAGEIFLTSIERDGSLSGYDIALLKRVCAAVDVPVVIAGGCGGWQHMREAFEAGADGAATSNIFHLPDSALANFKRQLAQKGVPVRV